MTLGVIMSEKLIKVREESSRITIQDVADALGISKTTVSRAISGKGRIGEATRKKVMDYIEEYGYHPSPIAKGLAQQKTYNIGWVAPGDSTITDLPFFQRCMSGVIEMASASDYDVLISMIYDDNMTGLERMINAHKVDGVILGRTLVDDKNVGYLKQSGMPFVVVGSTNEENVIQVDNDNVTACKDLTTSLLENNLTNLVLIGGSDKHVVNQSRREGLESAVSEYNKEKSHAALASCKIYMNSDNDEDVWKIINESLDSEVDCIVCMDDKICNIVLREMRENNIDIPGKIKVASFYNSDLISNSNPKITALQYEPKELGMQACRILLSYIEGEQVPQRTLLSYDIIMNESTGSR